MISRHCLVCGGTRPHLKLWIILSPTFSMSLQTIKRSCPPPCQSVATLCWEYYLVRLAKKTRRQALTERFNELSRRVGMSVPGRQARHMGDLVSLKKAEAWPEGIQQFRK